MVSSRHRNIDFLTLIFITKVFKIKFLISFEMAAKFVVMKDQFLTALCVHDNQMRHN